MACSLDLLGRMYMPGSPGTVPRYMLPVMVGAGSGWRRGEVHGVEQGGSWCSHRGWWMPYGVTCTAKGPTARWSLWGWMLLRRATALVWDRPSLIHTASARDAAGFRQSVMMPVIVRLWVASDTLAGGGADAGDGVVVMEVAGLAPCIVPVLGLLGGGVHGCVFGPLVWTVSCVEGGGPGGGVVEGGVWEVPPCCPCVQGGRGGPFRLYGVSPVWSATGEEDVGSRQLIHLCGVGEVAGDGALGGVVLAGGGMGNDLVGRPFVVGGVVLRVQLYWGLEWHRRWGLFLGLRVGRHFGFDQVLRAPGFRGPYLCGCRCCGLEEGGCVGVQRGGGWLGGEGVVVFVCPPNCVASLGVAVRGLNLGLLDG